jgi:Arc/MetJ-type ribon-helix-helix transcriptional regulator
MDDGMKATARYKAISVTVPAEMEQALSEVCRKEIRKRSEVVQEALRLYFRARSGKAAMLPFVMPGAEDDRKHTDLSAFAPEWSSSLDSAYDTLSR